MNKRFKDINILFGIIIIILVSTILLSTLLKEGMFMDGLIYSTISRNMSLGIGSLWYPKFTETYFPIFNEHPPLVFGIQSLFFKLFGTSIYIERMYSFFTAIVTLFLIKKIWQLLFSSNKKYLWWFPLLFWIITPVVFWSYSNNMLECTMGIFTLLAVYFSVKYIKSESKIKYLYVLFTSIFIVLGMLSKGFPALFPLAVIPTYWIVYRNTKFGNALLGSISVLILVGLIFYVIMLNNSIYNNISTYINSQVLESISGSRNPGNRMFIVIRLLRELLPMIIFSIVIALIGTRFRVKTFVKLQNKKVAIFSLLIGLAASLPVAISPKQMGFYIIPAFPFFAIAFASFSIKYVEGWVIKIQRININIIKIIAVGFFILLSAIVYKSIGKYSRDEKIITDVKKIINIIPKNTKVSAYSDFHQDWGFVSYLYRYGFISIDKKNTNRTYYIMKKNKQFTEKNYKKLNIKFNEFDLYKRVMYKTK